MAGRPTGFDRDEALLTAQHEFWRSGFASTSVSELTRLMGINPPSLYAAFGSKRRLFDEAATRYVRGFRAGVLDALAKPSCHAALTALLEVSARAHTDPGSPPGCLVLSAPELAAERDWLRRAIADRVEQARSAGGIDHAVSAAQVAVYLESVLVGMSELARDGAGRTELRSVVQVARHALPDDRDAS